MKKILVLGATGFIGGHITRLAIAEGWQVHAFRRTFSRTGDLDGFPIHWIHGDLMDTGSLLAAMSGIDIVYHAAAFYPKDGNPKLVPEQVEYARQETKNVIDSAQKSGVSRLIYTSTLTTIGHPPHQENRLADERDFYVSALLPKSGYYESKIAMEQDILTAISRGLPAIILNPTAVFGPGDVNLTMGRLLIAIARGWVIGWLPGDINVVDVRDVAAAHISAVNCGRIGERYIIGGHNYSVREALILAARTTGVRPPRFEIPMMVLHALTMLGDLIPTLPLPTNHLRALHLWQGYNTHKACNELNFEPISFEVTVRDSLEWYRKNGYF